MWFQNRRAKWRRQEKNEFAKLSECHTIQAVPKFTKALNLDPSPLPMDPWLTPAISSMGSGLTSPPFPLAHPACVMGSSASRPFSEYLPASLAPPCGNLGSHLQGLPGVFNPVMTSRSRTYNNFDLNNDKSYNFQSLRVRTRERF